MRKAFKKAKSGFRKLGESMKTGFTAVGNCELNVQILAAKVAQAALLRGGFLE